MYRVENTLTGEFWYFKSIRSIATFLGVSYQSVYMVTKKCFKRCQGWTITEVTTEDPIIGEFVHD